jgi:HAD superfamily phosphatase (TIGR01668 family)
LYNLLCPRLIIGSLQDINIEMLIESGIRGLIFDLDNTIIPWDSPNMGPKETEVIHNLISKGLKICLVSNNRNKRVNEIAGLFGIPFISRAYKPAKNGFKRAALIMELSPEEVAVVGDQLYTDILGGNRLGMYTIWVKPLSSREFIGTKITRQLEKLTVRILKAKGLLK